MKKFATRVLSLVMILAMLFVLGGCGGSDADKLVGTWTTALDLTELLNDEIAAGDETMAAYVQVKDFTLNMTVTFKEDGTYTMGIDEASMTAAMEGVLAALKDGMYDYFEDVLAEAGLNMTVDELLAESGISMDELMDEAFSEAMKEDMFGDLSSQGNFEVKDGKLFLSDGLDYAVDETIYEVYTLKGNTLTFEESVGSDLDQVFIDMYPLIFEKVN